MGIEFMTGAMIFALIDIIIFLIITTACVSIIRKLFFTAAQVGSPNITLNIRKELMTLAVMTLIAAFVAGSAQPKLKIEPTVNRALIEYREPIIGTIITPPPWVCATNEMK